MRLELLAIAGFVLLHLGCVDTTGLTEDSGDLRRPATDDQGPILFDEDDLSVAETEDGGQDDLSAMAPMDMTPPDLAGDLTLVPPWSTSIDGFLFFTVKIGPCVDVNCQLSEAMAGCGRAGYLIACSNLLPCNDAAINCTRFSEIAQGGSCSLTMFDVFAKHFGCPATSLQAVGVCPETDLVLMEHGPGVGRGASKDHFTNAICVRPPPDAGP